MALLGMEGRFSLNVDDMKENSKAESYSYMAEKEQQ